MTGPTAKVTEVRGAYAFDGITYGPFQAGKDTPYLEVPVQLATALGLPLHESEVKAREAAAAQTAEQAGSVDTAELQRQNAALAAQVDALQTRIRELESQAAGKGATAGQQATPSESDTTTALPVDFPMRDLLMEHGFTTLEAVRADLNGEKKIDGIKGVGPATLKTIIEAAQQ